MKDSQQDKDYCPISAATKIIGDFWSILIIRELLKGPLRFNQLQNQIDGITGSTLSDRLKKLAQEEIVQRQQYESIPPKVEYSLTEKGYSLKDLLSYIEEFAHKWY